MNAYTAINCSSNSLFVFVFALTSCRSISEYYIDLAGELGRAKIILTHIKNFKSAGHKLAQYGYLSINGSCHEWKVPLVTTAIDTQILFGGVYIWRNRP